MSSPRPSPPMHLVEILTEHDCAIGVATSVTLYPSKGLPEWFVGPDGALPELVAQKHSSQGALFVHRMARWTPYWTSHSFIVIGFAAVAGKRWWGWGVAK